MRLSWAGFSLDFRNKTCVMGVINVTRTPFSDGGLYYRRDAAVEHALRLADEGADIIDIGGESTRPGLRACEPDEEIQRTILS